MPILIRDSVKCTIPGHPYFDATGEVKESKEVDGGEISHRVVFPARVLGPDEEEHKQSFEAEFNQAYNENVVWLLASELEKV